MRGTGTGVCFSYIFFLNIGKLKTFAIKYAKLNRQKLIRLGKGVYSRKVFLFEAIRHPQRTIEKY